MFALILKVDQVHYAKLRSEDGDHIITAAGRVPTSGWGSPMLSPHVYLTPPADGIQEFAFIAEAPGGIVIQIEQPVATSWIGRLPGWAKGVRIHASTNAVDVVFARQSEAETADLVQRGGEIPWPLAL